jgi:hypothetical protein
MHLIQILIPVFDNQGQRFAQATFEDVRGQLMERFGGLTAFVQSPALGLWKDTQSGATARDDMILIEVMAETFERDWWTAYRTELEQTFRQDEIVVRAIACERV